MKNLFMRVVMVCLLQLTLFIPWSAFASPNAPDTVRVEVQDEEVAVESVSKVESDFNIDISITRPSGDTIEKYVYIWNNSDLDAGLDAASTSISNDNDPAVINMYGSSFSSEESDYSDPWYFHVKSVGLDNTLSDESRFGPFYFDTVGPTGTIKLTDKTGQYPDSDTSDSSIVTFEIISTPDISSVYLSNTASKPQTSTETITDYSIDSPYVLQAFETSPTGGVATVYVWFEDNVGNISNPTIIDLTINSGKKMEPEGDRDLGIGATLEFAISGASSETFNWSVIDVVTENDASAVASVGTEQGPKTVITGLTEGSIKVKAVNAADGTEEYLSGIITVKQIGYTITHSYKSGLNLVPFSLTGTGLVNASDLRNAIENANSGVSVSQIFGWDADSQAYSIPYAVVSGSGYNNFPLTEGAAYFIETDGTGTLELMGNDFSSISVSSGLNLLSAPYSKLNSLVMASDFDTELGDSTSLNISQIFGWDADSQAYSIPYAVVSGTGYNDFTLSIGAQGYFVELSGDGIYTP